MEGKENISGVAPRIWIAPLTWMTTVADTLWFTPPVTPGNPPVQPPIGDLNRITGDHIFATGKGFIEIQTTYDTGVINWEQMTNRDQSGGTFVAEFFYPGTNNAFNEFIRFGKTLNVIALLEDTNRKPEDGKYPVYQVGSRQHPAQITANFSTSNITGDRKGYSCTLNAFSPGIIMYEGLITLHP